MRHQSESLKRTIALTLVCAVALILAVSAIGYVGERIVNLAQSMHKVSP